MEAIRERLTVLKEYMTPQDMMEYFGFKSAKTFENWEKDGLKVISLTTRTKFYRADDIREYLNNK
jgi:hypothetical protein|nr:MAG TPA: Pyocin activator protein PrtN [Caudoviricetes sp.]